MILNLILYFSLLLNSKMQRKNELLLKSSDQVKDKIQINETKSKNSQMQNNLQIEPARPIKNFSLYNFLYGSNSFQGINLKNNASEIFNNRRAENLIDTNLLTQNILTECLKNNEETQDKLMEDLNKYFSVNIQRKAHAEIDLINYNLEITKKRCEVQIKSQVLYYENQISVIKNKCYFLINGLEVIYNIEVFFNISTICKIIKRTITNDIK